MKENRDSIVEIQKSPRNCEATLAGLCEDITKTDSFYVRNHFETPEIDSDRWRLDIYLDRSRIGSYKYDELSAFPHSKVRAVLECAGNGRKNFGQRIEDEIEWGDCAVGTAEWSGVPVADLLKNLSLSKIDRDNVKELLFVGADGSQENSISLKSKSKFVRSLPLQKSTNRDTIVALFMNGKPLSRDHGFPSRLIVPGWYAMASVKWLKKIILSTSPSPFMGYFNWTKYVYETEQSGNLVKEPIKNLRVKSLITNLEDGATLQIGKHVAVSGKAWSGFGKIVKVEFDSGDGWKEVTIHPNEAGEYSWTNWEYAWTPQTKGKIRLRVRATDEKGNVQPESPQDNRFLYGFNGIRSISVKIL